MNKMLRFDFLQMGACEVVCYVFLSLVFAAASLRFPHVQEQVGWGLRLEITRLQILQAMDSTELGMH